MRAAHENLKGGDFLGRHIVAEFFEANFDALNDAPKLEAAMNEAALASGATILSSHQHFFEPHGVSCVVIIQESNLCIHTWPEFGYAAADFFTCGEHTEPWKSFEFLKKFLQAKSYNCLEFDRGSTSTIKEPCRTHKQVQEAISLRGNDDN
jgi:S-adenosylmethionine decarboxylase